MTTIREQLNEVLLEAEAHLAGLEATLHQRHELAGQLADKCAGNPTAVTMLRDERPMVAAVLGRLRHCFPSASGGGSDLHLIRPCCDSLDAVGGKQIADALG